MQLINSSDKPRNSILAFTYVLLTAVSCLSIYDVNTLTKLKAAHVLFIGIALLHFMLFFRTENLKTLWSFLWRHGLFLIVLLDLSLFIYLLKGSPTSLIKLGIVKVFYQFLTLFVGLSAVYLFGEKAVDYTFWGFVLFNTISIFLSLKECGISGAVWSINKFLTTGGDADGFMKRLELHDATFAFGLFLIYYFMTGVRNHKKKFFTGMFFFAIGYKRIGIAAMAVAMMVSWYLKKLKPSQAKRMGRLGMFAFFVMGASCVVMIRSELFEYIMNELNINMMGRQNLFAYIKDFYVLSPRFIGNGFESVRSILASAGDVKVNNTYISRMAAIHSDYLRMYIELGFWGFLFWEWFLFLFMPKQMWKFGKSTFIAYVACTVYVAITYFTDNTAMFFLVSVVYRMIPLQVAVQERRGISE